MEQERTYLVECEWIGVRTEVTQVTLEESKHKIWRLEGEDEEDGNGGGNVYYKRGEPYNNKRCQTTNCICV